MRIYVMDDDDDDDDDNETIGDKLITIILRITITFDIATNLS